MRKWNFLFALMATALLVPTTFGQTQEDLLRKLDALDKRLKHVEAENADLKSQITDGDDGVLENQVNALIERYAGTTVNSDANPVTLVGELRLRNYWQTGDAANDDERDGTWTDARVRLGFQYDFNRDVTAYVALQSDFAFGNSGVGAFGDQVYLYEAWIEVRNVFNQPNLSWRIGRQEIVLGNQFQFGNADWYDGFSFDGSVWTWDDESFRLTAMILKLTSVDGDVNQVPSYFTPHDDDELYGLYFTLKTIENHELDLYWIYINGHGGGAGAVHSYFHTVGARIGGTIGGVAAGLDWNLEIAYQFGDQNNTTFTDVDGLAIEGEVGLTFDKDSMFRVYIRGLWAEGADGDETGYIFLFTNRHSNSSFRARYGIFDLIGLTNVFTLQAGFHFNPDPDWTLGATFLWATTDEDIVSGDDDYGYEIDLWGEYRFSEHLVFGAGLAILFPDDSGVAAWGLDDDTHFLLYLQARLLF